MAIGRTNCGGSNILNLKVVGGTSQPASPAQNTVWVNTEAEITEWVFSSTRPTARLDGSALSGGEVWFKSSSTASTPINVLKKNGAYVYPNSSFQYVNGTWVDKTAQVYQGGAWVGWEIWFYDSGNEFTGITGGWSRINIGISSVGTVTKGDNFINLRTIDGAGQAGIATNNIIDLTNVDTLIINVTSFVFIGVGHRTLCVLSNRVGGSSTEASILANKFITSTGQFSLNTASITEGYVAVLLTGSGSDSGDCHLTFNQISKG